jgi:hypothetical protein
LITGHAGEPGLIEAFRQTGTAAVIDRENQLKSRKRGLSPSEMAESLLALWAAGGERAEDLDQFRQDKALTLLLRHDLLAAQTARDFLAQFHARGSGTAAGRQSQCAGRVGAAVGFGQGQYRTDP